MKNNMKANTWRITGYRGRNDYDGPADDNTNIEILFDSRLKKEDVEENFKQLFMKSKRSENKPKNKSVSITLGDLLNKELIEYKK